MLNCNLVPICRSVLSILLCASAPAAFAHHSSAPHFDRNTTVVKEAVFTDLKLVNPHAYIYFDVTENGVTHNWRCELTSASQLKRLGWTAQTFKPGEPFTMAGHPAWREDHVCLTSIITRDDGTEISRNTDLSGKGLSGYATVDVEKVDLDSRMKYLPNGQPNFTGNWRTVSFGRGAALAGERETSDDYKVTEAGKAAQSGYDMAFDDPILRCHYVNLIKAWNHDAHINRIEQTDDKLILHYGFMDVTRTVHLNQDSFPDTITPSDIGYSIGRWDGDSLIVETTGFEAGVLEHSSGIMHSDQLHAIERFYINPETHFLMRESVLTDPLYLDAPKHASDGQELVNLPMEDYDCTELSGANNIRPGETVTYSRGTGVESYDASVQQSGIAATDVKAGTIGPDVPRGIGKRTLVGIAILAAFLAALGGLLVLRRKPSE